MFFLYVLVCFFYRFVADFTDSFSECIQISVFVFYSLIYTRACMHKTLAAIVDKIIPAEEYTKEYTVY